MEMTSKKERKSSGREEEEAPPRDISDGAGVGRLPWRGLRTNVNIRVYTHKYIANHKESRDCFIAYATSGTNT